jgi:hypothetical protein
MIDELLQRTSSISIAVMPGIVSLRRALRKHQMLSARWLRVAIVVSLWHAPIPWVHVHELEGPTVDRLALLSQHVSEFHARDVGGDAGPLDWHMHVILPWDLIHHAPCPDQQSHEPGADDYCTGAGACGLELAAGKTIGQPLACTFLAGELQPALAPQALTSGSASAAVCPGLACRQFFASYGSGVAVRDLTGVRTC